MTEIKCPCGLREEMDKGDCDHTDCEKCCPLSPHCVHPLTEKENRPN